MQIFPIAKWWNTPLTIQPLWSPNAPYYPLTLRPNSGLDCLNNAPSMVKLVPPCQHSFRICNKYLFFMGIGSSTPHPSDLEYQGTTHLKPIPHGLPYYHLGCCWHSFRIHWGTKAPLPSRKYALYKLEVLRGINAPYISIQCLVQYTHWRSHTKGLSHTHILRLQLQKTGKSSMRNILWMLFLLKPCIPVNLAPYWTHDFLHQKSHSQDEMLHLVWQWGRIMSCG